ncbi:MAG: hypothetical protein IKA70_00220 [Alistipes sp.]|nr:hypothetical protein [Alistipes sp.]
MKALKIYLFVATLALLVAGCTKDESVQFASSRDKIAIGAAGGAEPLRITSSGRWVARTNNEWIMVSPANGRGSADCKVVIDSTLLSEKRMGVVYIENIDTREEHIVRVEQEGFPLAIELDDEAVAIKNYDSAANRFFEVTVQSNVAFDVKIQTESGRWLTNKSYTLTLDRGYRPREVKVRFNWDINTKDEARQAKVQFEPRDKSVTLAHQDALLVTQDAAEPIIPDTRAGDSVALLCIQRALRTLVSWDSSESMQMWNGVKLWQPGMEGYTEDKHGRVHTAEFTMFNTEEKLPFEVKYLTAARELYFFGNTNTFMRSLELGDDICELHQLKRLTLGSYGLVSLPDSFKGLRELEYLNICSNNFQTIPAVLTSENFPQLHALIMNANQRHTISDLSNTTKSDVGGFIDEPEFPKHLLLWDKLDTLVLSVNYLHGELPTFEGDTTVPEWTAEDIASCDTLPSMLVGKKKILPRTKRFAINYNRLTGRIPDWLLYHPALDWWVPFSLVFNQEGKTKDGALAKFDNEPPSLNYYYEVYPKTKRLHPDNVTPIE